MFVSVFVCLCCLHDIRPMQIIYNNCIKIYKVIFNVQNIKIIKIKKKTSGKYKAVGLGCNEVCILFNAVVTFDTCSNPNLKNIVTVHVLSFISWSLNISSASNGYFFPMVNVIWHIQIKFATHSPRVIRAALWLETRGISLLCLQFINSLLLAISMAISSTVGRPFSQTLKHWLWLCLLLSILFSFVVKEERSLMSWC